MTVKSSESPKQILFTQFASVAKALGHPLRIALLEQLAQGERSVDVLADRIRASVANASQHLQQMRRAGLLAVRREGKFVYYQLADESVLALIAAVRQVAERHSAEVERVVRGYFHDRDSLEAVSREELMARMKLGLVTILDVRPPDEYALGHLPGALNVQLGELAARLAAFDPAQEIIAYCRGPYCVLSYEAIVALRALGLKARRLEDGLPEWRAAGLPVEAAAR